MRTRFTRYTLVAGLLAIGLAIGAVWWIRHDPHAPRHKDDAYSYDTYLSPDGQLEARVYAYMSFFTVHQEVTLRRMDAQSNGKEVSLGCDQAEDGSQITAVTFPSNDTVSLERISYHAKTLVFDSSTLIPVLKLGPC